MKRKYYFWMAVVKPRKSRCWLPMPPAGCGGVIIGYLRRQCLARARAILDQAWVDNYAPFTKFCKPSDWQIKAVKVGP